MQDIGLKNAREVLQPTRSRPHLRTFVNDRHSTEQTWLPMRPMKPEAIDVFLDLTRVSMLRAGQLSCRPAESPLLAQDGEGPEGVAAVNGNRVIENVKDAGHAPSCSFVKGSGHGLRIEDVAQESIEHQQSPQR